MNNLTKLDMTYVEDKVSSSETLKEEYNECEICCSELDSFVTLRCKHKFHYECIFEWYLQCKAKKNSQHFKRPCPYCRSNGGYLDLPTKDSQYIAGIHKPSHKPSDTIKDTSIKIEVGKGQCLGIAKSTGKQCKLAGKPQYSGYCGWHKNQLT